MTMGLSGHMNPLCSEYAHELIEKGLQVEGGVTALSLHNAKVLIERFGLPDSVELFRSPIHGHALRALWFTRREGWAERGPEWTFTGFPWGYGGEGPHGLETFFEMLNLPIGIREIAGWSGFMGPRIFVRGQDYPKCTCGEPMFRHADGSTQCRECDF